MRKTAAAFVLLGLLAVLSAWNVQHMDALTGTLCEMTGQAGELAAEEKFEEAAAALEEAIALWEGSESYTHIFIRHAEIDAASDAFYELQSAIFSHDADAAAAGCGKLLYHLRSMSSMEHVTVKSVF